MDILIVLLLLVTLFGAKWKSSGHSDYLGKAQTTAIKGIFAVIILYSHLRGYLPPRLSDSYDYWYYFTLDGLGQFMVVMFLLYSGYGIMEALKIKRAEYTKTFLTHRVGKIWIMFIIAVALFVILNLILGIEHDPVKYITCWIGWDDIGNSNWFVFDIIILYLLTYIALLISNTRNWNLKVVTIIVYVLTFCVAIALNISSKGSCWYDTIMAYPTGMLYSIYKKPIETFIKRIKWITALLSSIFILFCCKYFFLAHKLVSGAIAESIYNAAYFTVTVFTSSVFAVIVLLLTMRLKLDNKILQWLGVNAFAIYLLQRISMIIATHFGLNENLLIYLCVVIPGTLLIAAVYTAVTNRINRKLFR